MLIIEHRVKDIEVRHGKLQVSDSFLNINDGELEILACSFQEAIDLVDMRLQDLDHFCIRLGSLLLKEMHAEDNLRHELQQWVVNCSSPLPPSRRPRRIIRFRVKQALSPDVCIRVWSRLGPFFKR